MGSPVYVYPARGVKFCFECGCEPEWEDPEDNEDNECFLCGADHSPLNAEANYYCRVHLDRDAQIVPLDTDARQQEPK